MLRPPVRTTTWLLALLLTLFGLFLAACGGDDDAAPADGEAVRTGTSVRLTTTTAAGAVSIESQDTDDGAADDPDGDEADDGDPSDDEATEADQADDDTATTDPAEDDSSGSGRDLDWPATVYALTEVASLDFPIAMATRSGSDDLWVNEREGRVRRIERRPTAGGGADHELDPNPVLDLTDRVGTTGEGGLLGLAFSPDGGLLYTSYTDKQGTSVVSEHRMSGDRADGSERIVLEVEQPFSNHNGGQITFGPDGFLYVALGDGGSGGDPLNSGQDTTLLLGSILRIDPFTSSGYEVPADNPLVGLEAQDEIWLWGVRNPWRFSFDRATGDLWIGDVGQNAIEEVTHLPAAGDLAGRGANLGWRLMEGDQVFTGSGPPPDHTGPIYTYGRDNGRCSVTGGYVYRGQRLANLAGVYVFADFCTSEIFGLERSADGSILVADVVTDRVVSNVVSFGEGPGGELYVLGSNGSVSLLGPS